MLENAYVSVESEGGGNAKIRAVGRWADFSGIRSTVLDGQHSVIMPVPINAHTHLEFSDLSSPIPAPNNFADWIQAVITHRIHRAAEFESDQQRRQAKSEICHQGLAECNATQVAAIGEIVTFPAVDFDDDRATRSREHVPTTPSPTSPSPTTPSPSPHLVQFFEVLGLDTERANTALHWAELSAITRQSLISRTTDTARSSIGLSPHAPYSTSSHLYRRCVDLCQQNQWPLATHLAETREELQLLSDRSGPLVALFRGMGIWNPAAIEVNSIPAILRLLVAAPHLLLIHGNYLQVEDWRWLKSNHSNFSIVYCPQTHQHFQHDVHPWPQMLEDGINVALGTDSKASSPSLDIWEDMRLAHKLFPQIDPARVFQMATLGGATALGLQHRIGSIEAGKDACLHFVAGDFTRNEIWEALFSICSNH